METDELPAPVDPIQAITREIELHAVGARVEELHPRRVRHALACGQSLLQLKDLLGHGRWNRWVEEHCGLSRATANRYMRLAARADRLTPYMTIREAYLAAGVIRPRAPETPSASALSNAPESNGHQT